MKSCKQTILILLSVLVISTFAFAKEKDKEIHKAGKHSGFPFNFSIGSPFGKSQKDILVIPSSEISGEQLSEITEDMAVMGRILDKQLPEYDNLFFKESRGIFLDGYGVLFLMKVDFPLLPVEEIQVEQAEANDIDPLWEQTKRELNSPTFHDVVIPQPRPFDSGSSVKYDKEKVDRLKDSLLKSLKYAANIRALKSDDTIILSVTSGAQGSGGPVKQSIVITSGNSVIRQSSESPSVASAYGILTIRAKKSDIDAFSKNELNLKQFTQKVTMLIY